MNTGATTDETNDASCLSWVASANAPGVDFPIQNLPIASFRSRGESRPYRGGIAIGEHILDLARLAQAGVLTGSAATAAHAASSPSLNDLMRLGPDAQSALRHQVFNGLKANSALRGKFEPCLMSQADAEYRTAADIGDYTDFYSSIYHATSVGKLFRPDNPLLPNYRWLPVGYHGRSSSIGVSGQAVRRPRGQQTPLGDAPPVLGASSRMDYELELGVFIGRENPLGTPIPIADAEAHIFGICLLNDWSARDLQAWEYQPLGPFLAKNFATTISPWVISLQALAPFRGPFLRAAGEPQPLGYLASAANDAVGALDIQLEVWIETEAMRASGASPSKLSSTSFRHAYWTLAQLVTHHSVNGCNLRAGDLLGTGTQSGPTPSEAGSLLELTSGGKIALNITDTEQRTFLQDGDRIILRGYCEKIGAVRIGLGEVSGQLLAAV